MKQKTKALGRVMQNISSFILGSISSNYICPRKSIMWTNTYSLGNGSYIYIENFPALVCWVTWHASSALPSYHSRPVLPPPSGTTCMAPRLETLNVSSLTGNSDSPNLLLEQIGKTIANWWFIGDVRNQWPHTLLK